MKAITDRLLDWSPFYRRETWPHGYACLSLANYARVLWARLTERHREYPVKPPNRNLIVEIDVGGPPSGSSVDWPTAQADPGRKQ